VANVQISGHRVTAAASGRHVARLLFQSASVLIADSVAGGGREHVLRLAHRSFVPALGSAKRAAGMIHGSNANVAEVYNQLLMMLRHQIFDLEIGRAYWSTTPKSWRAARSRRRRGPGSATTSTPRSVVRSSSWIRDDILNLHVVTNLPVPGRGAAAGRELTRGSMSRRLRR
jgi:hypothetical protein